MKKYFFTLTFIFSFFFLGLSTNLVSAEDMQYQVNQADPYDNRIIDLTFSNYHGYTEVIRITELRLCEENEDGCQLYPQAKSGNTDYSDRLMKVVGNEINTTLPSNLGGQAHTIRYTIQTEDDGNVYILVRAYQLNGSLLSGDKSSVFVIHKLSTLNQRVVINPDGIGKPTYTYDNIQYTAARNNSVSIELFDAEYEEFTGEVYVCEYYYDENHKCLKYMIGDEPINYYIESYNDGEKNLNFYLIKRDHTLNELEFNDTNSTLVSKRIVLDTVGPKITIKGGQWIFVESGKKYSEQEATCKDSVFESDTCVVTNDLNVVRIDYTSDKYQLITYEATDRLGNTSSIAVKVKVEIITKDNSALVPIVISVLVFLTTIGILSVVVYKNHQKKKKLSYI